MLEVLREHPDMLLKEEHFAARQINWDDKVTNLQRIAAELNIGTDSLVLLDDSEFETDFVRRSLPEVAVIALPPKAYATYRSELAAPGWFDSLSFTAEDRRKNAMYGENRRRKELESSASSLEEYLANLAIEVEIAVPSEIDVPRVAQLTQKTNQFNLTTRRYTEADVRAFVASDRADVLALKVRDRIADSGLVGVAILTYEGRAATIDSFLLSCRVIGRGVEDALLSVAVRHALDAGCDRVAGVYVPTAKNAMVADFYARRGFAERDRTPRATTWERSDGTAPKAPAWITLRKGPLTHAGR